jgi:hypothetical protein
MHLTGITLHCVLAERATQHAERFIERVAGLRLLLLRPQQPHQVFASPAPARRPGQVHKKRQVLPPEQLWRSGVAVGSDFDRTQQPAAYH